MNITAINWLTLLQMFRITQANPDEEPDETNMCRYARDSLMNL